MSEAQSPSLQPRPLQLINDARALGELIASLNGFQVFGIDTESNSMHAYFERVCLVQLSTTEFDALIDPLAVDLAPLGRVLADARWQKVFHAAEYDIIGLKRDFGFEFRNVFDTSIAARMLRWPEHGLGAILRAHFGYDADKRYQKYDWGRRPLEDEAVQYARNDSRFLPALAELQQPELQASKHFDTFIHACERVVQVEVKPRVFDNDGFWRIRGSRELPPTAQAVLATLYRWRDKVARELDRPPFKVASDGALLELATAAPTDPSALVDFRGLHPRLRQRRGWQLVQVIAQGLGCDPPDPPRPKGPQWDSATVTRYDDLRRWRRGLATQEGLEPDLLLSKTTLQELAVKAPMSEDELEHVTSMDAWERERYGAAVVRVIAAGPPRSAGEAELPEMIPSES